MKHDHLQQAPGSWKLRVEEGDGGHFRCRIERESGGRRKKERKKDGREGVVGGGGERVRRSGTFIDAVLLVN